MRDKYRWERWEHRHALPPPFDHEHWGPPWRWKQQRRRGRLFLRFVGIFGLLLLLVVGGMAALAFALSRVFGGGGQTAFLDRTSSRAGPWVLDPVDEETTRLIVRVRQDYDPSLPNELMIRGIIEPGSFVMQRRTMLNIKELAEQADR